MKIRVRFLMFCLVCLGLGVSTAVAVEGQTAWVSSGRLGGAVSLNGDQCLVGVDVGEFATMTPQPEEEDEPRGWRDEEVRVLKTETDTLLNDPLINFDRILFVKRLTYHSSHFYTDFIDGCSRFGGNLCVLDRKTGQATDLIPEMKHGIFGRFDLHFNADKIVFDWKEGEGKGFRIFEIDMDPAAGTRIGPVRQLTFPPDDEAARIKKYDNHLNGGTARMYYHQTDDMHPCYLPDGGIVFTSSRCEYGTLCDAPDHLSTTVLHRMNGDGTHMQQLTRSPVSEFSPSIMEDGRVLYTRWEYVDKGQLGIKCLWAMLPDGSGSVEIYGNDIQFPPTFLHGRQIPGQSEMFVMLGTPHYPQSGIGTVIRVDTSKNIRTREPMTYMTPYVNYRPGERRSCVGCHEMPNHVAPNQGATIAMKMPAVLPGPQPGDQTGQQVMHFPSYVQPVLDRHCIVCHSGDEPKGELDLTGTLTDRFSRSYENIMKRKLVKTYREASDWEGSAYSPPKTIGSHASGFIMALREGKQHADLDLPLADFARLATWVDASGVYYGSYWGRRRLKYRDHPNFRPVPTFEEALSPVCSLPVDQR